MNSFKLLGIRFSYKKNSNVPDRFRLYGVDDMSNSIDHIWYMSYSNRSHKWMASPLKFVTVLLNKTPIRLRFNGTDTNILCLSLDKYFVKTQVDLYNSYDKTLA